MNTTNDTDTYKIPRDENCPTCGWVETYAEVNFAADTPGADAVGCDKCGWRITTQEANEQTIVWADNIAKAFKDAANTIRKWKGTQPEADAAQWRMAGEWLQCRILHGTELDHLTERPGAFDASQVVIIAEHIADALKDAADEIEQGTHPGEACCHERQRSNREHHSQTEEATTMTTDNNETSNKDPYPAWMIVTLKNGTQLRQIVNKCKIYRRPLGGELTEIEWSLHQDSPTNIAHLNLEQVAAVHTENLNPMTPHADLKRNSALLTALHTAGADNWEGYETAMEMMSENDD